MENDFFIYLMNSNVIGRPHFVHMRARFFLGGGFSFSRDEGVEDRREQITEWVVLAAYPNCREAIAANMKMVERNPYMHENRMFKMSDDDKKGRVLRPPGGENRYIPTKKCAGVI